MASDTLSQICVEGWGGARACGREYMNRPTQRPTTNVRREHGEVSYIPVIQEIDRREGISFSKPESLSGFEKSGLLKSMNIPVVTDGECVSPCLAYVVDDMISYSHPNNLVLIPTQSCDFNSDLGIYFSYLYPELLSDPTRPIRIGVDHAQSGPTVAPSGDLYRA